MVTISHIRPDDWGIQTNEEHQQGVACLAAQFADEFDMGEWGMVMGLLHDKGKEKATFQQHIKKESGYKPDIRVEGDYKHAYVGALLAKQMFPTFNLLIDNALMGHHRGLYDYGEMIEMMKLEVPDDVTMEQIQADLSFPKIGTPKDIHHLQRMLFF